MFKNVPVYDERMIAAGKPPKVALIALARKLLTILNAMARDRTDWQAAVIWVSSRSRLLVRRRGVLALLCGSD